MAKLDYFYDAQIRNYLLHITRLFGNFKIITGYNASGDPIYREIPCRYVLTDRQVASILKDNSENVLNTIPFLTVHIASLIVNKEKHRFSAGVDNVVHHHRHFDLNTGKYTAEKGQTYHIQRMNPVPFDMNIQLDIWTTKMDHKLQLMEQILLLFHPAVEIQTSTNPLDWTALTNLELSDITWSNTPIPVGTEDMLDSASLMFKVDVELSPPADVKRATLIHQILTNIKEGCSEEELMLGSLEDLTIHIYTPGTHQLRVDGNILTLLGGYGQLNNINDGGNIYNWKHLIERYGVLRPGVSQIRIRKSANLEDSTNDIVGIIEYDEDNPNQLIWLIDPDTLPQATLPSVDKIIDPTVSFPENNLPISNIGQRYLLVNDLPLVLSGDTSSPWGFNFTASSQDIIEYDGSNWMISLDASQTNDEHIVINTSNGNRFRLVNHEWIDAYNGDYLPGYWRLVL